MHVYGFKGVMGIYVFYESNKTHRMLDKRIDLLYKVSASD